MRKTGGPWSRADADRLDKPNRRATQPGVQARAVRAQQRGWPRAGPGQLRQLDRHGQMAVIAIAIEATLKGPIASSSGSNLTLGTPDARVAKARERT